MASKLIPLADKLVLRPIVQEEVLSSGIVIPDTAKEKPNQGEVIAVGPGRRDDDGKLVAIEINLADRVPPHRRSAPPAVVDDGVSIAKEIELSDPFENMGAQLAKEISSKTNDVA